MNNKPAPLASRCRHSIQDYVWVGRWSQEHKRVYMCLFCNEKVVDENSNEVPSFTR